MAEYIMDELRLTGMPGETVGDVWKMPRTKVDSTLTQTGQAAEAKKTGEEIDALNEGLNEIQNANPLNLAVVETATGAVCSFADGGNNMPVKSLVANIEYSESGYTGATVKRIGKNILPLKFYGGFAYDKAVGNSMLATGYDAPVDITDTVTIKGDTASKTGSGWGVTMSMLADITDYIGQTLIVACDINAISGYRRTWYLLDENYIIKRKYTSQSSTMNWILTPEEGEKYLVIYMNSSNAGTYVITNPQIELGTVKTSYQPYDLTQITYDWTDVAGTIYGGSLDVTNGKLTSTLASDGTALAEPVEYTLTPHDVKTVQGINRVWANTGDVTVQYYADTKLYIESLTEPDADMVADANIVSGSYFMVGNVLYKATANIASGATITPNVNCTRKSLAEALNELNA